MAFSLKTKMRMLFSSIAAIISLLYQLETGEDLLITEKLVVLAKNKTEIFDHLSNLENYVNVSNKN
jgi:hypothetical protein